jgi:hypothetical protein
LNKNDPIVWTPKTKIILEEGNIGEAHYKEALLLEDAGKSMDEFFESNKLYGKNYDNFYIVSQIPILLKEKMMGFSVKSFIFGATDDNLGGIMLKNADIGSDGVIKITSATKLSKIDSGVGLSPSKLKLEPTMDEFLYSIANNRMGSNIIYSEFADLPKKLMIEIMNPEIAKFEKLVADMKGKNIDGLFTNEGVSNVEAGRILFGTQKASGEWVNGRIQNFIKNYKKWRVS